MKDKHKGILFLFCTVIFFFCLPSAGNAGSLAKTDASISEKLENYIFYFLEDEDYDDIFEDIISEDIVSGDVISEDVISDDQEPSDLDILNEQGCNSGFVSDVPAWVAFAWAVFTLVCHRSS
jgi:hypothetical protein